MSSPIVVLTDFGTEDPFVGIMKGVIAGINPTAPVIDLTHEIPPGDIQLGAFTLWQSLQYFPTNSVFLAVVDPGVGSQRRPIILKSKGSTFVGPDNGIFSYILSGDYRAWELKNPKLALSNPSATFHGRDLFAPAAAYAGGGVPGGDFGPAVSEVKLIPYPQLSNPASGIIEGEIIHIDRFGNALSSIGVFMQSKETTYKIQLWTRNNEIKTSGRKRRIGPSKEIDLSLSQIKISQDVKISWHQIFGDIPDGEFGYIIGSSGLIEITANLRNASKLLDLKQGDTVALEY